MNRMLLLVVAVLAVFAVGAAVCLSPGDGEADDGIVDGEGGEPPAPDYSGGPVVVNPSLGGIRVIDGFLGSTTLRAEPEPGCVFVGWYDGDGEITDLPFVTLSDERLDDVYAVFGTGYERTVSYNWQCPSFDPDGEPNGFYVEQTFCLAMDAGPYYSSIADGSDRGATYAAPMPVHRLSDSYVIDSVVSYLEGFTEGLGDYAKATVIAYFVQDVVTYMTDAEQYGEVEYWTTPEETLYSGYGDCEDGAALFVNIALRMGLDAGFVAFEDARVGHMSAAVSVDPEDASGIPPSGRFEVDGATYVYVETADAGYHVPLGQTGAYDVREGNWTEVGYDPDTGMYTGEPTVPIGSVPITGSLPVYG